MRLSEKTIELSICSQLAACWKRQVIWWGLTQRQEARAGFDACTKLGARLLVFQFKASNELREGGVVRRFHAPHRQMAELCRRVQVARCIYYVLPDLGTTAELLNDPDLLAQAWALDVHGLRGIGPPTNNNGSPRRSTEHYLDLEVPFVTVRSEPVKVSVTSLSDLADALLEGPSLTPESAQELFADGAVWPFSRKSLAGAILPRS